MSPLSQCLPTTRETTGAASLTRETRRESYSAWYSDVRMLSLMPPSTLM